MEKNGFQGMLNYKQAAAYVGMGLWTFRKFVKRKRGNKLYSIPIPFYKVGFRFFFKPEDLDQWMNKHRTQ